MGDVRSFVRSCITAAPYRAASGPVRCAVMESRTKCPSARSRRPPQAAAALPTVELCQHNSRVPGPGQSPGPRPLLGIASVVINNCSCRTIIYSSVRDDGRSQESSRPCARDGRPPGRPSVPGQGRSSSCDLVVAGRSFQTPVRPLGAPPLGTITGSDVAR